MTAHDHNRDIQSTRREPRTLALVGRYAHRHLLDGAGKAAAYRVVLVESTAHAYSKIKRALPDLIVVCLSDDDPDGCQVLSMLALDRETSRIPVLTHITADVADFGDLQADAVEDVEGGLCAMALH